MLKNSNNHKEYNGNIHHRVQTLLCFLFFWNERSKRNADTAKLELEPSLFASARDTRNATHLDPTLPAAHSFERNASQAALAVPPIEPAQEELSRDERRFKRFLQVSSTPGNCRRERCQPRRCHRRRCHGTPQANRHPAFGTCEWELPSK